MYVDPVLKYITVFLLLHTSGVLLKWNTLELKSRRHRMVGTRIFVIAAADH